MAVRGDYSLDLRELEQRFLDRVESASGKKVVVLSETNFAGHATIKIAAQDQPAHVLRYKPEQEAVRPYLVAFQCEFALRSILAEPASQFQLSSDEHMMDEVLALMQQHHKGKSDIPADAIPQLAKQFGNGLGLQLRSMPITMRVDQQIHDAHPDLRDLQRKSIDRQLQENVHALSPRAKILAPDEIIKPNASMNAAYAKFFSGLWDTPIIFTPYVAAGYGTVASELLAFHERIPPDANHDRKLIDVWAKHLGLDRWFKTKAKE